jgi:sulfatase maturation enzyme AslB (radical SAM superfamily)
MQDTLHKQLDWKDVTSLNGWYKDLEEFNETRTALDNGYKHTACESCWAYEDDDMPSMRTQNLYYTNDVSDPIIDIKHVDLRLSNKCNLQCKMCHPGDSDQLTKLANELPFDNPLLYQLPKDNIDNTDKLLNLILDLPNLEAIRFAGGEPFIMPEVEQFIEKLVSIGKTHINIEFITNCTSAKPKIISLLECFDHVELMCSIDGIKDTLEYQRYPAKWLTIESNFKRLYNSKCSTRIVPCVGLLNYNGLPDFFQWAQQFPDSLITFNEIQQPSYLDYRLIPLEHRIKNLDVSRNNITSAWIRFINESMHEFRIPTQTEVQQLKEYIKVWDYRCNEKFIERYPYMQHILQER